MTLAIVLVLLLCLVHYDGVLFVQSFQPNTPSKVPTKVRKTTYNSDEIVSGISHSRSRSRSSAAIRLRMADDSDNKNYGEFVNLQRRNVWKRTAVKIVSLATIGLAVTSLTRPVWASTKSRVDGYKVQKSGAEWKESLSTLQYDILRNGGTERPGYSILDKETRPGIYNCAGCGLDLFVSDEKFNSGTGWPSFASNVPNHVETEQMNPVLAGFSGAELRCTDCGGHLGDVFQDGRLFLGTPAAVTGQRYCIDGGALIFIPTSGDTTSIRGDTPKPQSSPSFLDPPSVQSRSR